MRKAIVCIAVLFATRLSAQVVVGNVTERSSSLPVVLPDGVESRDRIAIGGVVLDSAGNTPVSGVSVSIVGTAFAARTDSLGHFAIAGLRPGVYSLSLGSATLDSLGASVPGVTVRAPSREASSLELRFPARALLAVRMCGGNVKLSDEAVARVTMLDSATGTPLRDTKARVWWRNYTGRLSRTDKETSLIENVHGYVVQLDSTGSWTGCSLPAAQELHIESVSRAPLVWSDTIMMRKGEVSVRVRRVTVRPGAPSP